MYICLVTVHKPSMFKLNSMFILKAFQGKCLKLIASVQYEIKKVNKRMQAMEQRLAVGVPLDIVAASKPALQPITRWDIPCETDDDLQSIENLIANEEKFNSLVCII